MSKEIEKLKILAAFDMETTGLDPAIHDIIEIAIVPLNEDFTRSDIPGFTARIKAVHMENADPESLKISGLNPNDGEEIGKVQADIVQWMTDNNIALMHPVAHNLMFDLYFFKAKFPALAKIFSGHGRDSMRLAIAINDISLAQAKEKMFPSVSLKKLKAQFGMEAEVSHRAVDDAMDSAAIYRHLMEKLIINK